MAHQLGGLYDMPHGEANAMLLPYVCSYNLISNPQKFADIAEFMGENISGLSVREAADKAIDALFKLSEDLGIPAKLSEKGIKEEDFEYMAEMALKDGNAFSNPRVGNKNDIINIFKAAY
jgi:1,3-propanediol dehydrogenase